ncbi:uncharacterized protein TrAtP1_002359 [Trichoderma atroviride]|nr:hypothetical protein TrAtP1_002359 [Trichoderma atroviride]
MFPTCHQSSRLFLVEGDESVEQQDTTDDNEINPVTQTDSQQGGNLNMDGKVIQAGRFDNTSSETDRDAMLRTLLETADMAESGEHEEMEDEELNMLPTRNDDELVTFQKLCPLRQKEPTQQPVMRLSDIWRRRKKNKCSDLALDDLRYTISKVIDVFVQTCSSEGYGQMMPSISLEEEFIPPFACAVKLGDANLVRLLLWNEANANVGYRDLYACLMVKDVKFGGAFFLAHLYKAVKKRSPLI